MARLGAMISISLAAFVAGAQAQGEQKSVRPGLYATVTEKQIYIIQGDKEIDVGTGESAFVSPDGLEFIDDQPTFLDWPCGTEYAGGRGTLPTISFEDLPEGEKIQTVAEQFFQYATVLEGNMHYLNGAYHGRVPAEEIDRFVSEAYWYEPGPPDAPIASQRPDVLIIGLFFGTGQVIVDTQFLDELKEKYGDEPIPVLFEYHDENIVPISYFGQAPTPGNIVQVYQENGIIPAEPPMIFAGDKHADFKPDVLADLMGAPPVEKIKPERRKRIEQDIAERGFGGKAVVLSLVPGGQGIIADEAERLRTAANLGIPSISSLFQVYDDESHARICGVAPPVAAAGLLGTAQGEAPGASPPREGPGNPLAPGGPTNSGGDPTPPEPPQTSPPEIVLPNPPQPELPGSDAGDD